MDGRDGRAAQFGQFLEHQLAVPDPGFGLALGGDVLETLDVGAGDETGGLAGNDDHALGRFERDALDHGLEFVEHGAAEGIDVLVGAVERQHQDAVGALVGLPMGKAKSVEHGGLHTWG